MENELNNVSIICDQYATADPRSCRYIISATLQDLGLVTEENNALVVERNKLRRGRKKARSEIIKDNSQSLVILFLDGRKDETLAQMSVNDIPKNVKWFEEHITLIAEPQLVMYRHQLLRIFQMKF